MYKISLSVIMFMISHALSAMPSLNTSETMKVGIKEAPPFVIKSAEGDWTGISIELLQQVAKRTQMQYQFKEQSLKQLLDGVSNGSLTLAIGALTISSDREQVMDFSHPFFTTGLGIAVAIKPEMSLIRIFKNLFSHEFLKAAGLLFAIIFIVGVLVWLLEHRKNSSQFDSNVGRGIGAGFWWSAVTMTTVGYGDKAPVTFMGRLIAVVWMFSGIIVISGFTAAIAASLTVTRMETLVRSADDLANVRVATIQDSSSETFLQQKRISYQAFNSLNEALAGLAENKVDALVYDSPLLKYYINLNYPEQLTVLPEKLQRQDYGIAMTSNSPLREPINQVILQIIREPEWQNILYRYLGE